MKKINIIACILQLMVIGLLLFSVTVMWFVEIQPFDEKTTKLLLCIACLYLIMKNIGSIIHQLKEIGRDEEKCQKQEKITPYLN